MERQEAINLTQGQQRPTTAGRGILRIVSPSELKHMEDEAAQRNKAEAEQQKPAILSLAQDLQTKFQAAVNARSDIELRLLQCRRQRSGKYDPDTLAKIRKAGGADVFMNLTSVKCRAAGAWIRDVLLQPGERPFSIVPTPLPDIPKQDQDLIIQEVFAETKEMMLASGTDSITTQQVSDRLQELLAKVTQEKQESAKLAASRFETKIDDEFHEGGFYDALALAIDDIVTYPAAFIVGPEVRRIRALTWAQIDDGKVVPRVTDKLVRQYRRINPFDIYPSPGARNLQDGYLFERATFSRSSLSRMIGVPGFSELAIRHVLRDYADKGFRLTLSTDSERAELENRPNEQSDPWPGIDTLIFWGEIQGRKLIEWGMKKDLIPDPDLDYQVTAWLVDHIVIGARLNSNPLGHRPYHSASYEPMSDSIWGHSPVELMRDVQRICNALARAVVNNAGMASGPQVEINKDRTDPDEDLETIWAWRIWKTKDDASGHGKPAIQFYQPQAIMEQLLRVYEYFFNQASEHTGIPQYIYGDANVGGAGKTAAGLSMLMNAASKTLKAVVFGIDNSVIRPIVREHWTHLMLYDETEFKCGDIAIVARASEYLIIQEQLQIRRQEFLNMTNNQVDMAIMGTKGRATVLREVAKGLKLGQEIIPSKDEIEAAEQAEKDALEAQTGAQMEEAPGAAGTAAMAQPGPRRAAIQTMPSRSRGINPSGGRAGGEQTRMAA